jgi:hypothetical protein
MHGEVGILRAGRNLVSTVSATLLAALIGAAAALSIVVIQRYSDSRERVRHRRAVATALVFEIKSFYRWFFRHLRPIVKDIDPKTCLPPTINAPSREVFAVYRANAGTLGTFDVSVVQQVVEFYGFAEWLLSTVREYTTALAHELQTQKTVIPESAPRRLLGDIQTIMFRTDEAAVNAGRMLGKVAGMSGDPFSKIGD